MEIISLVERRHNIAMESIPSMHACITFLNHICECMFFCVSLPVEANNGIFLLLVDLSLQATPSH